MTDQESPEPKDPKPEEPEHGFVEELRHDVEEFRHDVEEIAHGIEHAVEEAVERVPEPVRWTVGKIVRLAVIVVVGLVVLFAISTLLYLSNHTQLMARWVTLSINQSLLRETDLTLEMADVRGNLFHEVRVIEPRIRYRGDNGPPVLAAPAIAIRASLFSLIRRDGKIEVQLEQPVFRIGRNPDGSLRLPVLRPGQHAPKKGSGTPVSVVHLVTRNGSAHVAGYDPIEGLDLDARVFMSPSKRVVLDRLRWKKGPLATRDFDLAGDVAIADSVIFRIARLRTQDLALSARAAWRNGSQVHHVSANLARVRWGWIAEATKNRSFDVPGEGSAVVEAVIDTSWRGNLRTKLSWNGLETEGAGRFRFRDGLVTVDDLKATSGETRLAGRFGWSTAGWRIGGDGTAVDPRRLAAIGVTGWPEGLADGWFQYIVDTRRKPASSRLEIALQNTMLAGFRADSGFATVTTTAPGVGSFSVRARRGEGRMNLDATLLPGGWSGTWRLERLRLEEWPDGRASGMRGLLDRGEGTIVSDPSGLHVEGNLNGERSTWLGLDADTWRLEGVRGRLLPTPDMEAAAHIGTSTYLGVHFDSAAVLFALGDGSVELTSIKAHAGDTLVRVTGLAHYAEGSWSLDLDQASAISKQFTWTAEPPIRLSGNSSGTMFDRLVARDGDASLAISGRWAAPTGSYDWQLRGDRLDLQHLGLPPEWGTAGRADVVLDVHGVPGDPRWNLHAAVGRPGMQKFTADSLTLELAGQPSNLDASAVLETGGGRLNGTLRFEDTAKPWPDSLVAGGVMAWLTDARRWSGEIRAEQLPIQSFHSVAPTARDWRGSVSGTLAIAGRPSRPELELNAGTSMLAWKEVTGDRVEVTASYKNGWLEVPRAKLDREGLTSSASGRMPLNLAFGATPVIPEQPMHWTVDAPNGDLGILPRVLPQIGFAAGRFEGSAEIGGTMKQPKVDGRFAVRDGRFRMAGREEVFDHVQGSARLDQGRIVLDTLSARQGQNGRVTVVGTAQLGPGGLEKYHFEVVANRVKAIETSAYAAEFDGRFTVTEGPVVHGQRVPFVTGRADVRRAVVLLNFANMTETQEVATAAAPLYWTYRVDIHATNNIHWQPPEGDIEFSADLSAEQTANELILYGEVKALRGHYYFLDNRFTVHKADLSFDNVSGVNPVLDAEAVTRIQSSGADTDLGGSSTSSQPHDVTVLLHGRAREPVIAFQSSPNDWTEDRILRELTVGRFYAGRLNLGDPVDNYLTRALNKTLSDEMSRAFSGYVNEWSLEREKGGLFAGEGDVLMGVGTQVTSNLQVRYRQRVPGFERPTNTTSARSVDPLERDIGAEYRLNRFIYVSSEVLQRRRLSPTGTTSTTGPEYNLNLKARWEY